MATAFETRCDVKSAPENREKRQKQTQDNAENDAGNDRKIERGMFALDPDIAGQSAQPFWRETAPHHQTYEGHDHANDHNEFAQFAHI
jgi:hypothetical protein